MKTTLVTRLDTVLKPATGFKASTEGPDTQLFKKITHAHTHIRTDSLISSPTLFVNDLSEILLQSTIQNTN